MSGDVARAEQVRHDNVINDVIEVQLQQQVRSRDSVDDWLTDINMTRYRDNFARCGYTHLSQLRQLTRRDLTTELGISLVGHQRKILSSVQALSCAAAVTTDANDADRTARPADPLIA